MAQAGNLAHGLSGFVNGASNSHNRLQSPPQTPPAQRSPIRASAGGMVRSVKAKQTPDLDKAVREQLRVWLDEQGPNPFRVHRANPSRKRKRGTASKSQVHLQKFDLDERLNVEFEVKPAGKWNKLKKYKNFKLSSDESLRIGDSIFVKHEDSEGNELDLVAQWKAIVHDIRALDSEHVYIRVSWLNRPDDLDDGRKPYHGTFELIPGNRMDIIDAASVNGGFKLLRWRDSDDDSAAPNAGEFFWRQTYDFVRGQTLSELRTICVDDTPNNPDEAIVQCTKADCRQWLHGKCIAEAAVIRADDETSKDPLVSTGVVDENSSALATARIGSLVAELFVDGFPEGSKTKPASKTEVVITDRDGNTRSEKIKCLLCESTIK